MSVKDKNGIDCPACAGKHRAHTCDGAGREILRQKALARKAESKVQAEANAAARAAGKGPNKKAKTGKATTSRQKAK